MKKLIVKKNYSLTMIMAIAFITVFNAMSQAQSLGNTQISNKKYVRYEIGHGAMHCPFLSPKLEAKLKEIKDIDNFFIDKRESYATFNLPDNTEMTLESLQKIGIDVGYPADDVIVKMDIKPILVPAKTQ